MLRGARVDHPFRSLKPRYNMTTTHPKVLEHYAEMVSKLVQEIPELGFITVWSNDSGAGFEHTKSLYVGRNGGAYMIREWKSDEEIGRLAGENVIRFLRNLQVAGSKVNPDFKVLTRMESFYGEHDTVWNGFGGRIGSGNRFAGSKKDGPCLTNILNIMTMTLLMPVQFINWILMKEKSNTLKTCKTEMQTRIII